jgi:hypothetical protein
MKGVTLQTSELLLLILCYSAEVSTNHEVSEANEDRKVFESVLNFKINPFTTYLIRS